MGADLTGANLAGVDLSGKDLTWTILTNTNLENTILTNTNLNCIGNPVCSAMDLNEMMLTGVLTLPMQI